MTLRKALVASALIVGALVLAACSVPSGSSPAKSSSGSAGNQKTLTFDLPASRAERPSKAKTSEFVSRWFPGGRLDGLRGTGPGIVSADAAGYAMDNDQFWVARTNDASQPLTYGEDARKLVVTAGGFSEALVVPVRRLKSGAARPDASIGSQIESEPVQYQVLLSGPAGISSFGATLLGYDSPGARRVGTWKLDPSGELVNWQSSIEAVARKIGFDAEKAYIVRTVYDLGGRPALYVSWGVFENARGEEVVTTLHAPPPIKATWKVGDQPLKPGVVYPAKTIFEPITLTLVK